MQRQAECDSLKKRRDLLRGCTAYLPLILTPGISPPCGRTKAIMQTAASECDGPDSLLIRRYMHTARRGSVDGVRHLFRRISKVAVLAFS